MKVMLARDDYAQILVQWNQDLRSCQAEHREFNSYECNNGTKYISFEKYQRLKKC